MTATMREPTVADFTAQDAWFVSVAEHLAAFRIPEPGVMREANPPHLAACFHGGGFSSVKRTTLSGMVESRTRSKIRVLEDDRKNFAETVGGPAGYLMLADTERQLGQRFIITPSRPAFIKAGDLVPLAAKTAHQLARELLKGPDQPVVIGSGNLTVVGSLTHGKRDGHQPGLVHLHPQDYLNR